MCSPHSLGILIEWKQIKIDNIVYSILSKGPHSLGILIEWKQLFLSFQK